MVVGMEAAEMRPVQRREISCAVADDIETRRRQQSVDLNIRERQEAHAHRMRTLEANLRVWITERTRICRGCPSLEVPCCVPCLQFGCNNCTRTLPAVGHAQPVAAASSSCYSNAFVQRGAAAHNVDASSLTSLLSAHMDGPASVPVRGGSRRPPNNGAHGKQFGQSAPDRSRYSVGNSVPVNVRDHRRADQSLARQGAQDRRAAKRSGVYDLLGTATVMPQKARVLLMARNRQVENKNDTPIQRHHLMNYEYRAEIQQEKANYANRKDAFISFYDTLVEKRRPAGQACPKKFKGVIKGVTVTFCRAHSDPVTIHCIRNRVPCSVSIVPREKTMYLEFVPQASSPAHRLQL